MQLRGSAPSGRNTAETCRRNWRDGSRCSPSRRPCRYLHVGEAGTVWIRAYGGLSSEIVSLRPEVNGVWWPPSSSKRVGRALPVRWVRFLPPPPSGGQGAVTVHLGTATTGPCTATGSGARVLLRERYRCVPRTTYSPDCAGTTSSMRVPKVATVPRTPSVVGSSATTVSPLAFTMNTASLPTANDVTSRYPDAPCNRSSHVDDEHVCSNALRPSGVTPA